MSSFYNLCTRFFSKYPAHVFMLSYYFCRVIARDIGGSDPERMSAEKTEQYVAKMFKDTCIKVNC